MPNPRWTGAAVLSAALLSGLLLPQPPAAHAAAQAPSGDRYHSYEEMVSHVREVARQRPDIVRVFSIGKSHEGRKLLAAEVSDNPGVDEGEPEVLFDGLHHAREHLSAEMTIHILDLLVGLYGAPTPVGQRVTGVVNDRRTWIVFMVNPDGLTYDLAGSPHRGWRKNRQPTPDGKAIGTDLNRNYGYRFGCCGASSDDPSDPYYRGPRPWSAPETRAMRDFVRSRVVDGRQRIRAHITFHSAGEFVLWPYGYTWTDRPDDMSRADHRTFVALGRAMAALNGYRAMQSSSMYLTDGDQIDWMYGRQGIFSFTFELYPAGGSGPHRHHPPDRIIGRETRRNRKAVLYLMEEAACPYAVLGPRATARLCGS